MFKHCPRIVSFFTSPTCATKKKSRCKNNNQMEIIFSIKTDILAVEGWFCHIIVYINIVLAICTLSAFLQTRSTCARVDYHLIPDKIIRISYYKFHSIFPHCLWYYHAQHWLAIRLIANDFTLMRVDCRFNFIDVGDRKYVWPLRIRV